MIESQEGFSYCFVRKKTRSVTSSWGGNFVPAFGRKRKKTERKSCVPDIFLKITNSKPIKKKVENTKVKFESNDNIKKPYRYKKQSVVLKSGFLNNNGNAIVNTTKSKRKRKKDKSCSHLCERLSINSDIEYNDIIDPNINKKESSDSDDSSDSDSSSDNKKINEKEEKNKIEVQNNEKGILNKKIENKTNYNHINFNINIENNKNNKNTNENKIKVNRENNHIINNSVEDKKNIKKSNIKINNDNNLKKIDINNLLSKKGNNNNLLSKKGNNNIKRNSEIVQINNFKNNDKKEQKELNNKRNNLKNSLIKKNKKMK
jgi:hypothetical protein